MNTLTVIASANSRLQTDVMLIRLRRAEIDCSNISVLFPSRFTPNAVGCWLRIANTSSSTTDHPAISCAGRLRKQALAAANSHDGGHQLADLLTDSGVDEVNAEILSERLEQGHILICVHASHETEASVAWHVFQHSSSDTIVVGALQVGHSGSHRGLIRRTEALVSTAA